MSWAICCSEAGRVDWARVGAAMRMKSAASEKIWELFKVCLDMRGIVSWQRLGTQLETAKVRGKTKRRDAEERRGTRRYLRCSDVSRGYKRRAQTGVSVPL